MVRSSSRIYHSGWENLRDMPVGSPLGAVVHRTQPSDHGYSDSAYGLINRSRTKREFRDSLDGACPAHLVIDRDGWVTQTAPLQKSAPHAWMLNSTHVGIFCLGDFRHAPMPEAQETALVGVCVGLVGSSGGRLSVDRIVGRAEVPEASRHFGDDNPGSCLSMDGLRAAVRARAQGRLDADDIPRLAWSTQDFTGENRQTGRPALDPRVWCLFAVGFGILAWGWYLGFHEGGFFRSLRARRQENVQEFKRAYDPL
jgi:hypothetical protein